LPLFERLDEKVKDLFGKRTQASTRCCSYFRLKLDISDAPNIKCSQNAFALKRAFEIEVHGVISLLLRNL